MIFTGNEHVDCKTKVMEMRNEMIKTQGVKPDLILLGDSITEGFNLNFYYVSEMKILNCGMSGDRLSTVNARLQRDVLDFEPSNVLFNMGINDFLHFDEPTLENADSYVLELSTNYRTTVKTMVESGINVYCASTILLSEIPYDEANNHFSNYMYINALIGKLNVEIKQICDDYGQTFIDYNLVLKSKYNQLDTTYTYDGIHLNIKGYMRVVEQLKQTGVLL